MATSDLEIKIRAVIEGLEDLGKIKEALTGLDGSLQGVSTAAEDTEGVFSGIGTEAGDAADNLRDVAEGSTQATSGLQQVGGSAESQQGRFGTLRDRLADLKDRFTGVKKGGEESAEGLDATGRASTTTTTTLAGLVQRLGQTNTPLGAMGQKAKQAASEMSTAEMAGSALTNVVTKFAKALLVLAGVKITFDYLKDAAAFAGQMDSLGSTLNVVGRNAGYLSEELTGFEEGLDKLGISTKSARESMVSMMQAGISLRTQSGETTTQIEKLARVSQDLSAVTGTNASEALSRLISRIQLMDSVGLRNMGLQIDMTAAQQDYAASIGKSANALSENEKRQAIMNAVLKDAAKYTGAYEESLESAGRKAETLKRQTSEFSLALGNHLLPAYKEVIFATSGMLDGLTKIAQEFDKTGVVAEQFGAGTGAIIKPLTGLVESLFKVFLQVGQAIAPVFQAVGEAIGEVVIAVTDILDYLIETGIVMTAVQHVGESLALGIAVVADAFKILRMGIEAILGVAAKVTETMASTLSTITSWIPGLGKVSEKLDEVATDSGKFADKVVENISATSEEFRNLDSSTARWLKNYIDMSEEMDSSATKFDTLQNAITKLIGAQAEGHITSMQAAEAMAELEREMVKAADAGEITDKEFLKLTGSLGTVAGVIHDELNDAFRQLGTTFEEVETDVSVSTSTLVGALQTISTNAEATSVHFTKVFSDSVSASKSVQELDKISEALVGARSRWGETSEAIGQAQANLATKFEEVYQAQLKNISTVDDWDKMEVSIRAMGESGVISIERMNLAIQEGEIAVNRLSPAFQSANLAAGRMDVAIDQVATRISTLDTAIQITAGQLENAFGRMASGYSSLGGQVEQSMHSQLAAVENRYLREASLIETSTASQASAENQKLALLISTEAEKTRIMEQSREQQERYADNVATAERAALEVRLKSFDAEVAAVKTALEEQGIARDEAERRIKEIDLNRKNATYEVESTIRQTKIDSLTQIRDRYQTHIDTLIAEEERLAARIKSIEEQKAMAKMSTEERIRAIQKSAMGDYERYEANRTDVANFQAQARAAFAKGEHDQAKRYLDQARNAAAELNTTVQDGEKVIISKDQAAKNAEKALRDVLQTQLELFDAEKAGVERQRDTLIRSTQDVRTELGQVEGDIVSLQEQAKQGTVINIGVNDTDAKSKLKDLDTMIDRKDRLVEVRTDLEAAKQSLQIMMDDIEAGRTVTVDGDTKDAMDALEDLGAYAEYIGDMELKMDAEKALAAIKQTKEGIESINNVQTTQTHTIEVKGEEKLQTAQQKLDAIGKKDTKALVEFAEKNAGQMEKYVTKITTLDGRTIYTEASMTGNYEQEAQKIEMIHRELGTKVTVSEHDVQTNSEEVVKLINDAHKEWKDKQTTSEHKIETNADTVAGDVKEAMTEGSATSQHQITSNADAAKKAVSDAQKTSKVTSEHEVESNAEELKEDVAEVLTEKKITSTHDIEGNLEDVKEENKEVLEEQELTSTHDIESNIEEVSELLRALNEYNSKSNHEVHHNIREVMGEIGSLQGRNTTSTHTVYVVKEYLFGIGGMVVGSMNPPKRKNDVPRAFAAGGPVLPQDRYPRMTGGTIGGAGNTDSENRTLDLGAFVLRKSAVQKHGAGNLLSMLDKAKTLPKQQSVPASGTSPAMLMPGEIVVDKDTVSRIGLGMLAYLNGDVQLKGGEVPHLPLQFANGGLVGKQAPTFIAGPLDRPVFGQAFAKGGAVTGPAANVVQVDLRGNKARASVEVKEEDQGSLLELLADLKARG